MIAIDTERTYVNVWGTVHVLTFVGLNSSGLQFFSILAFLLLLLQSLKQEK